MTKRRWREPQEPDEPGLGWLAKGFFLAVILGVFAGAFYLAYTAKRVRPSEYEGRILDKWAGYTHSELGSSTYFRLLVEYPSGQRSTVAIDQETYYRARVGMWIKKTPKGIELSSLTALPPDVRKRLSPSVSVLEWRSRKHPKESNSTQ